MANITKAAKEDWKRHDEKKKQNGNKSASVTGYMASLEKACLDIYMSYHASQVRKLAASVESAWSIGQEIWTKQQNKTAI